jgi:hypothetical protein
MPKSGYTPNSPSANAYDIWVDDVAFKVRGDATVASIVRAWCSRKGLDTSTTVLLVPRSSQVLSVLDDAKVRDVLVQGERLQSPVDSARDPPNARRDDQGKVGTSLVRLREVGIDVHAHDSIGGTVVFKGNPDAGVGVILRTWRQRNGILHEIVGRVERTGTLVTINDERKWKDVFVSGDRLSIEAA